MAIWISRYSNKELQSGKYYPVGISIGTPKFPLGYMLRKQCYSLAQNRDFVDTLLDNIEQEKVTKMRTAMLTRYPENKEVRGIMKLVNRVEDKKNGYKLTYEAELVEGRTEQQTLQEWLRRENEWQKNRAKASSKSKDAK